VNESVHVDSRTTTRLGTILAEHRKYREDGRCLSRPAVGMSRIIRVMAKDHLGTIQAQALPLAELAGRLAAQLAQAYGPDNDRSAHGSQPLRDAFEGFGTAAAGIGTSLEDALAVAAEALQGLFHRIGGHSSDPATTIAAGIALAAAARSFHSATAAEPHPLSNVPTQVARLKALHLINRSATTNVSLTDLLDTTVREVAASTVANACAIFLYDQATDSLALRSAIGLNPSSVGALTVRRGLGITGQAAIQGKTIVATDARRHVAYLSAPATGDVVYASQISVPIIVHGSNLLVGVLNILSVAQRSFDNDEVAFLETIAGELAISIENSRMHSLTDARLRRKVTELGTLQRVSRTVASSLDLQDVLRLITEAAVELTDAEAAAIYRVPRPAPSNEAEAVPTIEYRTGHARRLSTNRRATKS